MSEQRRAPQPEDLYRIHIATDPRLSPDGAQVAFVVQSSGPGRTDYRSAIWLAPVDASGPPRQVTLGTKRDTQPRFSPDGRELVFLSDRRPIVEEEPKAPKDREDATQVHLLSAARSPPCTTRAPSGCSRPMGRMPARAAAGTSRAGTISCRRRR